MTIQEMLRFKEEDETLLKACGGRLYDKGSTLALQSLEAKPINPLEVQTPNLQMLFKNIPSVQPNVVGSNSNLPWESYLRYAPVLGNAIAAFSNKPDYRAAESLAKLNLNTPTFKPVDNYLQYTPFDKNFYINKLNSNAAASRSAIVDLAGGNRATAMAGLLASDFNYNTKLGDLARQAEEYNVNQRQQVEAFNRGTNQYNSEMGLKTAQANQDFAFRNAMAQAELRDRENEKVNAAKSANFTNLFESLSGIGQEALSRKDLQWLIDSGVFGKVNRANGGKIKTKKRLSI